MALVFSIVIRVRIFKHTARSVTLALFDHRMNSWSGNGYWTLCCIIGALFMMISLILYIFRFLFNCVDEQFYTTNKWLCIIKLMIIYAKNVSQRSCISSRLRKHANCFARTKEERRDKLIWNNNRFFSPPPKCYDFLLCIETSSKDQTMQFHSFPSLLTMKQRRQGMSEWVKRSAKESPCILKSISG